MTIDIRPIELSDVESYRNHRVALLHEPDITLPLLPEEYPRTLAQERRQVRGIIAHPNQHIIVAVDSERVVGQCAVRGRDAAAMRHNVGLGIDVAADYRGQGIGRRLLEGMLAWCRANDTITRVELDVFAHNHRAIGLYLKHGFALEGRKVGYYIKQGVAIDSYIMALHLD